MFRQPAFGIGEIAWRWSFGFAAGSLLAFCFVEYLSSLPVNGPDMFLLRTRQPALVSQALAHILRGSGPRLLEALLILTLTMAACWVVSASLGRAATLRAMLGYLRQECALEQAPDAKFPLAPLAGLNFLRLAISLAALVGLVAAWMLAALLSPAGNPSPGAAVLVFLAIATLVWLVWSMMNWVLSLASVFVVAEGEDTFGSLAAAVGLCRDRMGSIAAVSAWFGLAHVAVVLVASSVVGLPLMFAAVLPLGFAFGGILFFSLLYFAAADFLYSGRLAAYLFIAESPVAPPVVEVPLPRPIPPTLMVIVQGAVQSEARFEDASIDHDEPILSDDGASAES